MRNDVIMYWFEKVFGVYWFLVSSNNIVYKYIMLNFIVKGN